VFFDCLVEGLAECCSEAACGIFGCSIGVVWVLFCCVFLLFWCFSSCDSSVFVVAAASGVFFP